MSEEHGGNAAIAGIGKRGCEELSRFADSGLGDYIGKYLAFSGDNAGELLITTLSPKVSANQAVSVTLDDGQLPEIFAGLDLAFVIYDTNDAAAEEPFLNIAKAAKKSGALTIVLLISDGDCEKNSPSILKKAGDATFFISARDEEGISVFNVIEVIASFIWRPGLVTVDFDDIKSVLEDSGKAAAGIGTSREPEDLTAAGQRAMDMMGDVAGMKNILFGITGGSKLGVSEIAKFAQILSQNCSEDANIIWGQFFDPDMEDEFKVVIIAAGDAET
jgi:cell division GTPase FtsZ